ncbi:MAG: Ig-like domain-containing protein [Chloroflexota bacterium]
MHHRRFLAISIHWTLTLTLLLTGTLLPAHHLQAAHRISAQAITDNITDSTTHTSTTIPDKFNQNASPNYIVLNANGFAPTAMTIRQGDTVTWHNASGQAYTLTTGPPPVEAVTVGNQSLFLPLITRQTAQGDRKGAPLQSVIAPDQNEGEFNEILAPGSDFTYTFNITGTTTYYVAENTAFVGHIIVEEAGAVGVSRISPADGESDVAVTRETIIEFDAPIAANSFTATSFQASFGGERLNARLQLSADGKRVTLFYSEPLPASARVLVTVDGDNVLDTNGNAVDADGDGVAGGMGQFTFNTLSLTTLDGTSVCGRVFASELAQVAAADSPENIAVNVPLQDVTITVDGQEETLRTTTDALGNFCLDPAPVGRFFVHIDGRTATNEVADGAYYPFVGKAWASITGQETNVGDVYLPLIEAGTLQSVSEDADTTITFADSVTNEFPELAGTEIMVPAGSLFADDGTRGGQVGIAPVDPARLPGALPPGLNFPVVITVQTDGATNFDTPAPICFANLPDPGTGEILNPGDKSALWSFNHDTGRFEVVGPMTVNDDGSLVCTDPGVGIEAPGWHGRNGGTPGDPCEMSTEDIIDTVVDLGAAAANCLAELAGVRGAIQKALKLAGDIRGLVSSIRGLQSSIQQGSNVGAARESLNVIKNGKSLIVNAVAEVTSQSPVGKVQAALKCAESILGAIESICGRVTSKGSECTSVWVRVTCIGVSVARLTLTQINNLADAAEKGLRELGLTLVCNGIDKIATLLGLAPNGTVLASSTLQDDDPVPPEVLDELVILLADTEALLAEYEVIEEYFKNANDLDEFLLETERNSSALGQDFFGYPANAFYLVEYANDDTGLELRGTTGAEGQFSVILRPESDYIVHVYDPINDRQGIAQGTSAAVGQPTTLTAVDYRGPFDSTDSDGDDLSDEVERIIGTNPSLVDTDDDGTPDGVEIQQGSDPLDGIAVALGIIGSADTAGTAVDICALNDLIVVADSAAGVALFNAFNGMNPSIIAQIDTPGAAQDVACGQGIVAVADGFSGLALIDVSDPSNATLTHQISLTDTVSAVDIVGDVAYVGTANGSNSRLFAVDLSNGAILDDTLLGASVDDVDGTSDALYALTSSQLHTLLLSPDPLRIIRTVASPGTVTGSRRWRVFAGEETLYTTHARGYNTFDISDPFSPLGIAQGSSNQFGWKQLVTNDAGLGIAAVGANSTNDGTHHISLYNTRPLTETTLDNNFLTQLQTPGLAAALTLYNGQAYVADSDAGMQVINYLAADTKGITPTASFNTNFSPGLAEADALMHVRVDASDDVQVRNVEVFVDGERRVSDGNYPFATWLRTPPLSNETFTLQVRVNDTGGNALWLDAQTIQLVPDATPPRVVSSTPRNAGFIAPDEISEVSLYLSEVLNEATVSADNVQVTEAGADGLHGTADDQSLTTNIAYDSSEHRITLTFANVLPEGRYRVLLSTAITDLAGNGLRATNEAGSHYAWRFRSSKAFDVDEHVLALFNFADSDDDTVTDSSGHNRHATLIGGTYVEGRLGPGLRVEPSDLVGVDWSAYAELLTPPYTIEMLLTPEGTSSYAKLFSFDDGSDHGWYYRNRGIVSYPHSSIGFGQVLPDTLHYIAFVSSTEGTMDVYYQGALLGSTPSGFSSAPIDAIFFRDDTSTGRGEQVTAVVEALRISSVARGAEEITLAQAGIAEE